MIATLLNNPISQQDKSNRSTTKSPLPPQGKATAAFMKKKLNRGVCK